MKETPTSKAEARPATVLMPIRTPRGDRTMVRVRVKPQAAEPMPVYAGVCPECESQFGHESDCSRWRLSPAMQRKRDDLAAKERRENGAHRVTRPT